MSYTVETYLGVAILIPKSFKDKVLVEMLIDMEEISLFPMVEGNAEYLCFVPNNHDGLFSKHWTEHDENNMTEILSDVSIIDEILKFRKKNIDLISDVEFICPEMKISFVFLTGGS